MAVPTRDRCRAGQLNESRLRDGVRQHRLAVRPPDFPDPFPASRRGSVGGQVDRRGLMLLLSAAAQYGSGGSPPSRRGSVTLHPCGAPAPGHAAWLTGALGFTIPPAWLCHAVPPLHKGGFSLPCGIQRTWGNHLAWPVVFTQAKTAPLCKGSCRRTPTEGLSACLADDAHTRRLASSICLCAINPPGMALPRCPPFAQGGLFFALRHRRY